MSRKENLQAEFERIVRIKGLNMDMIKNSEGDYLNLHTAKMYGMFRSGFGYGLTQ